MKPGLMPLTLLLTSFGSVYAQTQSPTGTPLLVQPPQTQTQPAVTFLLAYPLLAMPETSASPSRIKMTLSKPADTLEVTGQPRGMFVSITQDTITVETKGVPVGQYPLRVSGRWGNDLKSVELLVSVYAMNGTVAPITGPAAPGPTVPTSVAAAPPAPVAPSPVTAVPKPRSTPKVTPIPVVTITAPPAPSSPAPSLPAPAPAPVTPPELAPVQSAAPSPPPPALTPTPAPVTSIPAPVTPAVAPATSAPSSGVKTGLTSASIPDQAAPVRAARPAERFTVWGGMGTERGVLGGLNVGFSSRVGEFSAFQVAVRGTAELYPSNGMSGLGLPVIGADLLLTRPGSRLYYGPSTALAFGPGNSWAIGGLVGYSTTLNATTGYYLEGRARYAHLGGENTLSPGFRVGITYKLGR